MARQHATPLLIAAAGDAVTPLAPLAMGSGSHQFSEAALQALVQRHPACLPIAEIDPLFLNPVPICTELSTPAGSIDNVLLTASGLPVLVECKLWRNPEGRREVVGQILDYAKELSRWSASDFQREVGRRLKRVGNPLLELVRAAGHEIDEIDFNDALTLNLRRGRFLLLIVGDGIREGVEAIAEYLQGHAGLRFTLGLVELPIYEAPSGEMLIVPRVLARTVTISREVVALPDGYTVQDGDAAADDPDEPLDKATQLRVAFMRDLVSVPLGLDPDQPTPRVSDKGWLSFYMPVRASSCWISVLFKEGGRRVGVRLTSNVGTPGEAAIRHVLLDWPTIERQLGGAPVRRELQPGRFVVEEFRHMQPGAGRDEALRWLRDRIRDYVAVFRPRIKDAVAALKE